MHDVIEFIRIAIRGAWRFRWSAMFVTWGVCLLGWSVIYSLPDIYEARARVFVDAESRLADVMGQVGAGPAVGSQVFVVRQALISQPLLESVANSTGLINRARTTEEKELLLFDMQQNLVVDSGRNRESRNLYSISFRDPSREMSVAVVTSLLNTFVRDVLDLKDQGADVVTGYLDDQLTYYGNLLSEAERKLAEFKKKYVGLLPGESGGIFDRLQTEMNLLEQLRLDLRNEEERREELRRQLQSGVPNVPQTANAGPGVTVIADPVESAIATLESRRTDLLLTYTERHPDVIAINEQLEQLYARRARQLDEMRNGSDIEGVANATNPVYQSVQISLNDAKVRIAGIRSEIAQREATVARLRSQVENIPEVEAQYTQLTRNYAQYRELYNEIMVRKERERMSKVGEEREVVTFNVIEPPLAGIEPVAPKRTLMLVGVLILGIGAGCSIAVILHLMNPVFHEINSLRELTGCPVLGVVSMTWMDRYRNKQRFGILAYAVAGVVLITVFAASIYFQDVAVEMAHSLSVG